MIARFNSTGTHIYKGDLKIRVDLYPELTDKTYAQHYVSKPVFPPGGYPGERDTMGSPVDLVAYQAWEDALPHIVELNPCLCHFVKIDSALTRLQLVTQLKAIFDQATVSNLDTILSELKPGYLDELSRLMKAKSGSSNLVESVDMQKLNSRLSKLEFTLGN